MTKNKILIINCSYHKYGTTQKVIDEKIKLLKQDKNNIIEEVFISNNNYNSCWGCNICCTQSEEQLSNISQYFQSLLLCNKCRHDDDIKEVIKRIIVNKYNDIYFATPVYNDNCTPKLASLLNRMSYINDTLGKDVFKDINAYAIITSGSSGTRAVGHNLLGSFEMLSFNTRGKCLTYYVSEWKTDKDNQRKIRGGYGNEQTIHLDGGFNNDK